MDGLPAPLLGQSLGLTVDESTPQGYSRVVGIGGREGLGGVITGTPLKVCVYCVHMCLCVCVCVCMHVFVYVMPIIVCVCIFR